RHRPANRQDTCPRARLPCTQPYAVPRPAASRSAPHGGTVRVLCEGPCRSSEGREAACRPAREPPALLMLSLIPRSLPQLSHTPPSTAKVALHSPVLFELVVQNSTWLYTVDSTYRE